MKSLIISAPHSGAGKTMVTLGLLRALSDRKLCIASGKSGPDYIDPQFHGVASGAQCLTLDAWAMSRRRLRALATSTEAQFLLIEGAMGLFDGAPGRYSAHGQGSTADVAAMLGVPVVLVLDVASQAQSAAAIAKGFTHFRRDISIAGVILNRTGSDRHGDMVRRAIEMEGIDVFGAVPRTPGLQMPSRHLGLVQAAEHPDLETFIGHAADLVAGHIDIERLIGAAEAVEADEALHVLPPPGQRVAVARDIAFGFAYPHILNDWRNQGAEVSFFSPLQDEGPCEDADAVYLPGGYPELHAGTIAGNGRFRSAMERALDRDVLIYGECGGYMVLGEGLADSDGTRHAMLGFLPLETSAMERKLHLGYRTLRCHDGAPWTGRLAAHEFHYSSIVSEGDGDRLFDVSDSMETDLGAIGLRRGRVMGSFAHVIDQMRN